MRSLFVKIFLWFWLTVILVGVALALSVVRTAQAPQLQLRVAAGNLFPDAIKAAAEEFERSGPPALAQYLRDIEQKYPVVTFFFDANGQELLGRAAPAEARIATAAATGDRLYLRGNTAAQRGAGGSARTYCLVLLFDPANPAASTKAGTMKLAILILPALTLAIGGVFCFLITRHITSPVLQLRNAVASISEGNLDTRVSPGLGRRRDEIGALGRDVDRMAERIQSLIAGHRRLLVDVSHELRSPLSRLSVALGLAKKAAPDEAPEYLERIAQEAHRLDKLIGQLLTLSRIESGAHAATHASIDLTNLVQEVASDAHFEAQARGRKVLVTSTGPCFVNGAEELLRSAIENVIRNAVRFTAEGTSVDISLRREEERAVLCVRDYGPGVPEELLAEIFLPFRRVPGTATVAEGAGLGLAIAERAVTMHRGTMRAINATDGGLTVEVRLPFAPRAKP